CAGTAALVLFVSAYAYALPRVRTLWIRPRIAEAVSRVRPCPGTPDGTVPYAEPSVVFLLGTATKLTDIQGAAAHLLHDPACALALVGAQEQGAFLSLMAAGKVEPREIDRIRGINYSNGKSLELILYSGSPAS